jgi:hypothetical protein
MTSDCHPSDPASSNLNPNPKFPQKLLNKVPRIEIPGFTDNLPLLKMDEHLHGQTTHAKHNLRLSLSLSGSLHGGASTGTGNGGSKGTMSKYDKIRETQTRFSDHFREIMRQVRERTEQQDAQFNIDSKRARENMVEMMKKIHELDRCLIDLESKNDELCKEMGVTPGAVGSSWRNLLEFGPTPEAFRHPIKDEIVDIHSDDEEHDLAALLWHKLDRYGVYGLRFNSPLFVK